MKLKKIIALVMALALVIGAFAACGGKTEPDTPTDAAVPQSTDAPAAAAGKVKTIDISLTDELYAFGVNKNQPELLEKTNEYIAQIKADGTLDAIVAKYFSDNGAPAIITSAEEDSSKDQLIVATNAAFPPFESMEGSDYTGIDMEIMAGLAASLGKELVIKNVEFKSVFSTVDAGYADITASGITVNESRKEFVNFTDTYYTASQIIIAPAGDAAFDGCATLEDVEAVLNGFGSDVTIGVQAGTTGQYYVEGDEEWEFPGLKCTCKAYDSGALAVNDLVNGNIQYVIIDEAPAKSIAASVNE
ncbi:MAG: transporter substrate-binding domain-containing protein [Clostridia bacterium]|nr:transporter substrate-binding domain-containing protein [Clostridia bacterium]MBR5422420.1 transporter substrate-binding domain-containing protein [Clostridia bacterium]